MARPSRGSNDHVKMAVPSLVGEDNMVSPISAFVLNTLIKSFFILVTQTAKHLNSSPGGETKIQDIVVVNKVN